MVVRCCLLHLVKLFTKTFSKKFNLNDQGTTLPTFPSKTNLISTLDKAIITKIDSFEVSGPDSIPVVVLKNCKLEFSYIFFF